MDELTERSEDRLLAMAIDDPGVRFHEGLERRVAERLREPVSHPAYPVPGRATRRWLAAALLMFGVATVFVVAWSLEAARSGALGVGAAAAAVPPNGPQEPARPEPVSQEPVPRPRVRKIAAADLPAAVRAQTDGAKTILDLMAAIASGADLPLVAAAASTDVAIGALAETVPAGPLEAASPRQLLGRMAAAVGAHLEQFGAVLAVVPGDPLEEPVVTLRAEAMPIADALAEVAKRAQGVNLVIDAAVAGTVTVDVERCCWRDLVEALARSVDAEVVGLGRILNVVPKAQAAAPPRVYFAFQRAQLTEVVATIGKIIGEQVEVGPAVAGLVTVRVKNQPAHDVLRAIAASQRCGLVEERKWVLR